MRIGGLGKARRRDGGMVANGLRVLVCAAAFLVGLGPLRPAGAQTTAETGVSVTTEDAGSLAIAFGQVDAGYTFTAGGSSQIAISAIEGAVATAVIRLSWSDTRIDEERTAYAVTLRAGDLVSGVAQAGGGVYTIPAGNLRVLRMGDQVQASPPSLATPQTVFTSADEPAAGDTTLDVVLELTIPAGTYPTTYAATLQVDVVPTGP